jgi:hypothetical protein
MSSSPKKSETFKYEKLLSEDSIRIFELQPSLQLSAEIHGRLVNETLSKLDADIVDHYNALSYVWGSTENLETVFVDGYQFNVTRNLRDALRALREPSRVVGLWADAICINQADVEERNQQVRMMGSIYYIARHTVIYLGESDVGIDAFFLKRSLGLSWRRDQTATTFLFPDRERSLTAVLKKLGAIVFLHKLQERC